MSGGTSPLFSVIWDEGKVSWILTAVPRLNKALTVPNPLAFAGLTQGDRPR